MEGALHVVGERGYRDASVRAILEYSGGHRKQFYDHFASLDDCFQQAYATWIERLGVSLLEAAVSAPGWRTGVRAGLVRLFGFVDEQPSIARSLFVEVHVAGGAGAGHARGGDRAARRGARQRARRDRSPARRHRRPPACSSSAASRPASATCWRRATRAHLGRLAGADAPRGRVLPRQGGGRRGVRGGQGPARARSRRAWRCGTMTELRLRRR